MKPHLIFSIVILVIFTFACSASQDSVNKEEGKKEEIYVFDDPSAEIISEADSVSNEQTIEDTLNFIRDDFPVAEENNNVNIFYTVQVGAFSTKEKAEYFVREHQKDISYQMEVSYSSAVNLFVIRLPNFKTKSEAEAVRDNLWKKEKFKDAFIVTVE